jgi:general L-amino acid transport system permease protein
MRSFARSADCAERPPPGKIPKPGLAKPWHSQSFRGWLYQIVAVGLLLAVAAAMAINASHTLAQRGIHTGFSFLFREAGFTISETMLPFASTDSFLHAFLAGLSNTLWISAISLVGATILGTLLGIARLSSNWLLARITLVYVEAFRNTPQLIQIIFWYTLLTLLPGARQAWHFDHWAYLSNRGLMLAWPADHRAVAGMAVALCAGFAASRVWSRWTMKHRPAWTGRLVFWIGAALTFGAPLIAWGMAGAPTAIEVPQLRGFNFHGGIAFSPEFVALALGLSLYIAAYIAEIVRAGIQSVGRGQIEAGRAIGLRGFDLLRRIILPQALRVIVPPLTAQYISLVKTSSLGVAVGYPELFNLTNTIITASGHTLECVAIMGLIYLLIALAIAAVMNGYNRTITLKEARGS